MGRGGGEDEVLRSCCDKASAKARRPGGGALKAAEQGEMASREDPKQAALMFKKHIFKEHIFENDSLVYCVRKSPLNWNLPRELAWQRQGNPQGDPKGKGAGWERGSPPRPP